MSIRQTPLPAVVVIVGRTLGGSQSLSEGGPAQVEVVVDDEPDVDIVVVVVDGSEEEDVDTRVGLGVEDEEVMVVVGDDS